MSSSYHFPNNNMNQNPQNGTQLNKDSQIYQPNINYDMQMANSVDWAQNNNSRRLDRNSNVFIPNYEAALIDESSKRGLLFALPILVQLE